MDNHDNHFMDNCDGGIMGVVTIMDYVILVDNHDNHFMDNCDHGCYWPCSLDYSYPVTGDW